MEGSPPYNVANTIDDFDFDDASTPFPEDESCLDFTLSLSEVESILSGTFDFDTLRLDIIEACVDHLGEPAAVTKKRKLEWPGATPFSTPMASSPKPPARSSFPSPSEL